MSAYTSRERTILGPLTTVFTPPAPCTVAIGLCSQCDVAWWGQTCASNGARDDTGCWPTTTDGAPAPESGKPLYGWGFYSPGLKCPAGYTSACSAIAGKTTGWKVQYKMEAEETFVGCCPTGFRCDNLKGQTCLTQLKSATLPTVSCESGSSNNFGFTTLPNSGVDKMNLYAPMIQIAWKPSDLPVSSSGVTTTTSDSGGIGGTPPGTSVPTSSLGTATTAPTPTSPGEASIGGNNGPFNGPSPSPLTLPNSNPLSTGAVAGIGIGAGAVFLLVLAAVIFVWRRRRRNHHSARAAQQPLPDSSSPPSNFDSAEAQNPSAKEFYVGTPSSSPAAELSQGEHERVEAPGNGHDAAEMFAGYHNREGLGTHGQDPKFGVSAPVVALVELPAERYH